MSKDDFWFMDYWQRRGRLDDYLFDRLTAEERQAANDAFFAMPPDPFAGTTGDPRGDG